MKSILFSLISAFALFSIDAMACGRSACPADDCDKDRCEQYVNRTGEFENRPRFRCIDMCEVKCNKLFKEELDSCKKDDKKADADEYLDKDTDSA